MEILKQPQYSPVSVEKQVAIIYLGTKGLLRDVPVNKVREFEEVFLTTLERQSPAILAEFKAGKLEDVSLKAVEKLAGEIASQYKEKK